MSGLTMPRNRASAGAAPDAGRGGVVEKTGLQVGQHRGGEFRGIGAGVTARVTVHGCPRLLVDSCEPFEANRLRSSGGGTGGQPVQRARQLGAGP